MDSFQEESDIDLECVYTCIVSASMCLNASVLLAFPPK